MLGSLEENLSIDDPRLWKPLHQQFIKGKPVRFGLKNWTLYHSRGYMVLSDIYVAESNTVKTFAIGGD